MSQLCFRYFFYFEMLNKKSFSCWDAKAKHQYCCALWRAYYFITIAEATANKRNALTTAIMPSVSCATDYCRFCAIGINNSIQSLSYSQFLTVADLHFRSSSCGFEYAAVTSQASFNRDAVELNNWMLFQVCLLFSK
ncbi:hypothetical protein L370_00771 [Enterobacter sp. MGH 24]|nr:hypothetical protein L370_00771 [Enterobacter sp. MGH 24]